MDLPEGDKIDAEVKNGKFRLQGHEDHVRLARISLKSSRFFGHIIVEPGESTFKFEIAGDDPDYNFGKPEVVQGTQDRLFFEFAEKHQATRMGRSKVFLDSIKWIACKGLFIQNIVTESSTCMLDSVPPRISATHGNSTPMVPVGSLLKFAQSRPG